MAPARLPRPLDPIYVGSTWRQPVQFLNEDRSPRDLTGQTATLYLEKMGAAPGASRIVDGVPQGAGVVLFEVDEVPSSPWVTGRYAVEVRLAVGDDILSVLVGEVVVDRGAAAGGVATSDGSKPYRSIPGVVIAATGVVQVVFVDRLVINGSGGGGGPASAYVHNQTSASALWNVNHNLGQRPSVTLLTTGGVEFEGAIKHLSANQFQVQLSSPQTGSARCI